MTDYSKFVSSSNSLGLSVLSELIRDNRSSYAHIVSPPLLTAGLAFVASNAKGETASEEILKKFGVDGPSFDGIVGQFIRDLSSGDVRLGQGLWTEAGVVSSELSESAMKEYQINANSFDKKNPKQTDVNGWASALTVSKITKAVTAVESNSPLLITDIFQHKGKWEKRFSRGNTSPEKFTKLNGATVNCKLMLQVGSFKYSDSDSYSAVLLPYENQLNAVFVIPKENTKESIANLVSSLAFDGFNNLVDKLELAEGCVSVPRFRFNSRGDFAGPLKNLGIKEIFTPSADFSSLSPSLKEVGLSHLVQAVTLEMDEDGKDHEGYKNSESKGFHFKADRNFLYFLHDEKSGSVLAATHVDDVVSPPQAPDAPVITKTCVFVGNLPMSVIESDLEELFGEAVKHVAIRTNKERKPFAFLDYADPGEAAAAVAKFNGHVWKGHTLKLDLDVGLDNKTPRNRQSRTTTRRRSPSPRKHSPSRDRRRRSPSPRRRRSPSPRRRSSPRRRRSPSPREKRRRSPSPRDRRKRSPSPARRRSPSPRDRRRRSPSPRRRSKSPKRRKQSSSSSSPSPKRRRSPSSSSSSSRSSSSS